MIRLKNSFRKLNWEGKKIWEEDAKNKKVPYRG